MKHIKTYEGKIVNNKKLVPKYKVGDYVLLDDYISRSILKTSKYAKIIDIIDEFTNQFCYKIDTADNQRKTIDEFIIKDFMSEKQIKKYELQFTSNKYNL